MFSLVVHWAFLIKLFWNSVKQFIDLHFSEVCYWKIVVFPLRCHVSLIFLCSSLKFCVALFAFEVVTSSSLYWLASREKCLQHLSSSRDSYAFSDHLYGCTHLTLPVPSCGGGLLILCAFFQSCKARLGAESLSFLFPQVVLWNACLYAFSQSSSIRLDSVLALQIMCKGFHWTSAGACLGSWPLRGGWST